MKKILLLFLGMGLSFYVSAQVIDIVGMGMHNLSTQNLDLSPTDNIDEVLLGVVYKNSDANQGDIRFWDTDEDETNVFEEVVIYKSNPHPNSEIGTFRKTFYTADATGVNADVLHPADEDGVHAFYAFVYRTVPDATFYSVANLQDVFFYHNGSADPYVYNLPITAVPYSRDVIVKVPISELDDQPRMAVIEITVGGATYTYVETTWSAGAGDSFFLGSYTITDVPGDVDNVEVSIYSPDPGANPPEENGDSFHVDGVVVDVEIVDAGCTLTQGYWKTHGLEGPAGPYDETWDEIEDDVFFSSGMDYYDAIRKKAKGNAYYILAHQYIAAKLNFISADPTDAQDAFDDATALFGDWTPAQIKKLKGNNPIRQQFIAAKDVLDDYNNGFIGPGHCDDGGDKSTEANINSGSQELIVYPNPMSNHGTLNFVASENANTTVEIYNLVGARVDVLFNDYVESGAKTSLSIDANKYPKGMYIVIVRNETTIYYKQKLAVIK